MLDVPDDGVDDGLEGLIVDGDLDSRFAIVQAAPPRIRAMCSRSKPQSQALVPGPSFTGAGNRFSAIQRQSVDFDVPNMASTVGSRTNPSGGSVVMIVFVGDVTGLRGLARLFVRRDTNPPIVA